MIPSDAALYVEALEDRHHFDFLVGDIGGLGKGYVEEARTRFSLPIVAAEKNNKRGYIELFNGDLARGRIKLVAGPGTDELIKEWANLPWDDKRQKEKEGFPNHCADSCLYMWRAMPNYHEAPAAKRAPLETVAQFDEEQEELTAALERNHREQQEEERDPLWWS
jgi:hypothetical protein